jgi:SagB-type dehydrogenase family enzyme
MQTRAPAETPLLSFWNATRLRANIGPASGTHGTFADRSFREVLAVVLGRGCGQSPGTVLRRGLEPVQARTIPSAGALYPFEVLVNVRDNGAFVGYVFDVEAGRITRLAAGRPSTEADLLGGAGLDLAPGQQLAAVVTLVARPWTAMAKYGQRGYLYTLLDIGHAASNLLLAAAASGLSARLHLRFQRQRLAEILSLLSLCREPQIVMSIAQPPTVPSGHSADSFGVPIWGPEVTVLAEPSSAEEANWRSLQDVNAFDASPAGVIPGPASSIAEPESASTLGSGQLIALPDPPDRPGQDFARVALRRRSVKGFRSGSLTIEQLGALFSGVNSPLDVDFAEGLAVSARILVRDVEQLTPGPYSYSPGRHALEPVFGPDEPNVVDDDEVMATVMGQAGLRSAAVLIHLHAVLRPLLRCRGRAGLGEIHFHAAHVAQRMCLNGARYGIGITCVGGFDEVRCASLVRLPSENEVIYVLAAGVPDELTIKTDREAVAYSHRRAPAEPE